MKAPPGYQLGPAFSKDTTGVYCRAVQQKLARTVTIKFLHAKLKDSERAREVFDAERRIVAGLEHPNLLLVLDVGEVAGLPYFVTESIRERTLADTLERGKPAPEPAAVAIALGMVRALQYLEDRGLIYKNIRQHNVLMARENTPKLVTFRNVRTIDDAVRFRGANVQSGNYCAPELVRDDLGPVTIKANVYAVGVIFFRLLTGEIPLAPGTKDARTAHAAGEIRTLRDVKPFLRDRAHEVVARLLAHDPAKRANPTAAVTLLEQYAADPLVTRPLQSKRTRRRVRRRRR